MTLLTKSILLIAYFFAENYSLKDSVFLTWNNYIKSEKDNFLGPDNGRNLCSRYEKLFN